MLFFFFYMQINYILKLVKPIISHHVTSFEVTMKANDNFNDEIQEKLSTSIWSNCASWYHVGYTGKICTQWPGMVTAYWWRLRKPIWGDYKVVGAIKARRGWRGWWIGMVVGVIGVASVGALWTQRLGGYRGHLRGLYSSEYF